MEGLHHGADDDARMSDQPDPSEEVPYPRFLRSQRNARLQEAGGDSVESSGASEQPGEHSREEHPRRVGFMSPSESDSRSGSYTSRSGGDDPWMDPSRDPWRTYAVDGRVLIPTGPMLREELDGKIETTTIGPTMMVATSGIPAANTPLAAGILTIGGGDTMLIPIVMEISVDERIVGKMLGVTITDEGKYQMLPWRKTSG